MRSQYTLLFLIIQYFSLSSYELTYNDNKNCALQFDLDFNNKNQQSHNNVHISWNVKSSKTLESFGLHLANYSIIAKEASPALQNYFTKVISPIIYQTTITNHHIAIPGYMFSNGLHYCINQLSQFSHSDKKVIKKLIQRLEIYCAKIEAYLFTGNNYEFCDTVNPHNQIKLARLYADFLKEFYTAGPARYLFAHQARNNLLMKQVMPSIIWNHYDFRGVKRCFKNIEQKHATSIDGKLGAVYKALHKGDAEKAYQLGHEKITVTMQKKRVVTTVFDRYPELYQKVKQAYFADKAKAEQIRIVKEAVLQKEAAMMKEHYQEHSDNSLFKKHPDLLANRYAEIIAQCHNPQFFEKIHKILMESVPHFEPQLLTPDEKGIWLEGGQLQHYIIDEAITVVDTAISCNLDDKIHDAVINLANASITLTKDENVLMASHTLDACWMLLDYGQAIVEGAALGVYTATTDMLNNPIGTLINTVAGKYILAYQLGKVFYNVADIGVTALIDLDQAKYKWDTCTKPVSDIIGAINKGEITGRDIVKLGTAFVVGIKTHNKAIGKLGKFGSNITQKTIEFLRDNSFIKLPEYSTTTPEGLFLKSTVDPKIKPTEKTISITKAKNSADSKVAKSSNTQNNKTTLQSIPTNLAVADKGIIRNVTRNLKSTIKEYEDHIFSDKHINRGIMALGKDKKTIMDSLNDIIMSLDKKGFLQEGNNQLKVMINGIDNVEIRCSIQNGEVMSINAFISDFGRIFNSFIDTTKV